MGTTLDGLREAVAERADAGETLDEIVSTIVDGAGLDAERRAALWLYARSCAAADRVQPGGGRVHASGRRSEPDRAGEREVGEMPYVRCPNCGLTSYMARNRWRAGECPGCGGALWTDSAVRVGASADAGQPGGGIAGALTLAHEQLDMDVALLTQVDDGRETVRESVGEWPVIGSLDGQSVAFEETFCARLLEGRISNIVSDAARDEGVNDLEMARALGVGAWIGVPIRASDARLYILCCLASEARPNLDDADVRFLTGLSETVASALESTPG